MNFSVWIARPLFAGFLSASILFMAACEKTETTSNTNRAGDAHEQEVPEGFQRLLPRGGIPAIDNPKYVSADQASISDDAFVFGIVIEDQPVAYSLNLLNSHEIVNDTIGETNFAAVW